MSAQSIQAKDDTDHAALMVARAWSSDELKHQQAELKRAVTVMEKQLSAFSSVVSGEEIDAIRSAVATFKRLASITAHAKEKKKRIEKFREDIAAKAYPVLKANADGFPLAQRLALATAETAWPSNPRRYEHYQEVLVSEGLVVLQNMMAADINSWCRSASHAVAYNLAKRYPDVKSVEIEAEIQKMLDSGLIGISPPDTFLNAISDENAANVFIKSLRSKLTVIR